MKVAAIQMPTVKDKIQNIRTAGTYIEKIKAENPDFVILPEMQKKKVAHPGRQCLIMPESIIFI